MSFIGSRHIDALMQQVIVFMSDAPQIFLVGVNHRIQYTNSTCGPEWRGKLKAFEDYLVRQVIELKIEELVARNHATACTVGDAALRARCRHCFCEPSSSERECFDDKGRIEARECYWLERVKETGANSVIFVCGDEHLSTFGAKLQAAGYRTVELSREWGIDWPFLN